MDRIDGANAVWGVLDFVIASISLFLGTHEAGEPWHILHWVLAIVFYALFATCVWVLIDDMRTVRALRGSKC